jgi:DNA adenine methylase
MTELNPVQNSTVTHKIVGKPQNLDPVLRYPGSKDRIAEWIVGHFPSHYTYVEPFAGSLTVFFAKAPSPCEILNDLSKDVVNLFRVVRDQPEKLAMVIELTPWARDEFVQCIHYLKKPFQECESVERARAFLVVAWQQFGVRKVQTAGGWRLRDTKAGNNPLSVWSKLPDRIWAVVERLKMAQIDNRDAFQLIKGVNDSEALIYADPPYLGSTRSYDKLYEHELKEEAQHVALLELLEAHAGPVVLSGYASELYQKQLSHWQRFETAARAQGNANRTETLWLNPVAWSRLQRAQPALLELP